jgi:hypothetical protein
LIPVVRQALHQLFLFVAIAQDFADRRGDQPEVRVATLAAEEKGVSSFSLCQPTAAGAGGPQGPNKMN